MHSPQGQDRRCQQSQDLQIPRMSRMQDQSTISPQSKPYILSCSPPSSRDGDGASTHRPEPTAPAPTLHCLSPSYPEPLPPLSTRPSTFSSLDPAPIRVAPAAIRRRRLPLLPQPPPSSLPPPPPGPLVHFVLRQQIERAAQPHRRQMQWRPATTASWPAGSPARACIDARRSVELAGSRRRMT